MTESQLQDIIHSLYEGDTSTPSASSEEYLARRKMMNAAINRWEEYEGTLWNELWVKLDDASDGDKTTSDGTLVYDCPSDFKFPGGYVRLVDSNGKSTYYSVVRSPDSQLWDNENKKVVWFSGNPKNGYKLNFLDNPGGTYTIKYEYYKNADTLTDTTSVPEMSDPYFIVYFTLSRLYKEERPGISREHFEEAEARLAQMKLKNIMQPPWQIDEVEDNDFKQGIGGFGV